MVLVKFISDIDCKIYIDKDFAGSIQSGKMLKILLDQGTYLVEVFDDSNKCIKSYELSVGIKENQILQNLSNIINTVYDVIENLKNDSSLIFYNQRAILRYGDLFGFINSRYEIVIPPIYSYAENFIKDKSLVKRLFPDGEKVTIIDSEGNICFGKWFDQINETESILLLKNSNCIYILSKRDYSIINTYFDAGYDGSHSLLPVFVEDDIDKKYGFIDKNGNEVVPLIYDYVWGFHENGFAKVMRFGRLHVVSQNGDLYETLEQALKEKNNKQSFLRKLTKEESLLKGFDFRPFDTYCDEYYPLKENGQWGLGGYKWITVQPQKDTYKSVDEIRTEIIAEEDKLFEEAKMSLFGAFMKRSTQEEIERKVQNRLLDQTKPYDELVPSNKIEMYKCDQIIYLAHGYLVYRIGRKCFLLQFSTPNNIYTYDVDWAFPLVLSGNTNGNNKYISPNILVRKNKRYGIISMIGIELLQTEYDEILFHFSIDNAGIERIGYVLKDKKWAFVNFRNGKLLTSFEYNSIELVKPNDSEFDIDSFYIVNKDGKFGCLDYQRHEFIRCDYSMIEYKIQYQERGYSIQFQLKKDSKFGTFEKFYSFTDNKRFSFLVEPEFDECKFLNHEGSIAGYGYLSFLAVRKNDKWGILDCTPCSPTVYPLSDSSFDTSPNFEDLEFKYQNLDDLQADLKEEFNRRYNKYYRPYDVFYVGDIPLISEHDENYDSDTE